MVADEQKDMNQGFRNAALEFHHHGARSETFGGSLYGTAWVPSQQRGQPYRPAIAASATSVIWHAFSKSSTCMSRPFNLWTPRIIVRTDPRSVSGGGSKVV